MEKEKRRYLLMLTGIVILLTFLMVMQNNYYEKHMEESPLYLHMSSYRENSQVWSYPEKMNYQGESAETFFLQGMEFYALGDYEEAKKRFQQAKDANGNDVALPAYLYFYLNQCDVNLTGVGTEELVALTMEEIRKYLPLIDDTKLLWDLMNSLSVSPEKDEQLIELLEEHVKKADRHMELNTWAWIKNSIGMLQFHNQQYTKSICSFYDVETNLNKAELTPDLKEELLYAKEYIANIYYTFEDYGKASELYQNLMDMSSEKEVFYEYCACINMASAYLEIHELEKAKEAIRILETSLPRMEEYLQEEVEASMNDVLANICLLEEDFAGAENFLKKAEAYYEQNKEENAFIGGKYYTLLTRSKYFLAMGENTKSEEILTNMIGTVDLAYYGLEAEVYKELLKIYQSAQEQEKLIEVYQKLLKLDKEFTETIKQGYMEFASYYQENTRLKESNIRLSRAKLIALWFVFLVSMAFLAMSILAKLLHSKNVTDQLTGVYNRKKLGNLKSKYSHRGTPGNFGVLMMDIDYFKKYNDTYGHPAGDDVLRKVAKVLEDSVRNKDDIIRYGGEEFLILMNDVQPETAEDICERIQKHLKEQAIVHTASEVSEYVTLSMGLYYQSSPSKKTLEQLIEGADKNLYLSKEAGRNRVTISK